MEEIIRQTILNIKEQPLDLKTRTKGKSKSKGKLFVDNEINDIKNKTKHTNAKDTKVKPKTSKSRKLKQNDSLELSPVLQNTPNVPNIPNQQTLSDDIEPLFGKELTKPFIPINNTRPSLVSSKPITVPAPVPASIIIPDPYTQLSNIVQRVESFETDFTTGKFIVRYYGNDGTNCDVIESIIVEPEHLGKLLLEKNYVASVASVVRNDDLAHTESEKVIKDIEKEIGTSTSTCTSTCVVTEPELVHTSEFVPLLEQESVPIIEHQTIEKFILSSVTNTEIFDFTLDILPTQYIKNITIFNSSTRVYPQKVEMGYAHNYTHTIYSACIVNKQDKFIYNYPAYEYKQETESEIQQINPTIRITDSSFGFQMSDGEKCTNPTVYATITNIKPSNIILSHKLLSEKNTDCTEIIIDKEQEQGQIPVQLLVWCNNICGFYNFISIKDLEENRIIYNWVPLELFDVSYNTLCVSVGFVKKMEIRLSYEDKPDRPMDSYPLVKIYQI